MTNTDMLIAVLIGCLTIAAVFEIIQVLKEAWRADEKKEWFDEEE